MKTIEIPENDNIRDILNKVGDDGTNCIICGRKTKNKHFVHMTTDWEAVPNHFPFIIN
jgi:hypothetical protein